MLFMSYYLYKIKNENFYDLNSFFFNKNMSYSDYEGTFDFEEQEGNNYIIYGVRVKYNSKEEADQIWERVENDSHRL